MSGENPLQRLISKVESVKAAAAAQISPSEAAPDHKVSATGPLNAAHPASPAAGTDLLHTTFNPKALRFKDAAPQVLPDSEAAVPQAALLAELPASAEPVRQTRGVVEGHDPQALSRLTRYQQAAASLVFSGPQGYDLNEPAVRLQVLDRYTQLAAFGRFGPEASGAAVLIAGAFFAGMGRLAQLADVVSQAHAGKELVQRELQELAAKLQAKHPTLALSELGFLQDRLHRVLRSKFGGAASRSGALAALLRSQPNLHDLYSRHCQPLFVDAPGGEGEDHAAALLMLPQGQKAVFDPWPLRPEADGQAHQVLSAPSAIARYCAAAVVLRHPF